jgi:UDP-N-acetylmuramyl pentapeptide phosphotransferase/UDP-N-acetylglucosamine-1-phosphate transferase
VAACGVVAGAEAVTIPLLRRAAIIDGIPVEAALGPLVLYIVDTAWTLQRRIRAGDQWLEAHRNHVYQRWRDAGWSPQGVTVTAAATTVVLSLLGAASLAGNPVLRAAADLAGTAVVITYLQSSALLARRLVRAEAS